MIRRKSIKSLVLTIISLLVVAENPLLSECGSGYHNSRDYYKSGTKSSQESYRRLLPNMLLESLWLLDLNSRFLHEVESLEVAKTHENNKA